MSNNRPVYSTQTGDEVKRHPRMPSPKQVARLMGSGRGAK
jgi:hypothetical protein